MTERLPDGRNYTDADGDVRSMADLIDGSDLQSKPRMTPHPVDNEADQAILNETIYQIPRLRQPEELGGQALRQTVDEFVNDDKNTTPENNELNARESLIQQLIDAYVAAAKAQDALKHRPNRQKLRADVARAYMRNMSVLTKEDWERIQAAMTEYDEMSVQRERDFRERQYKD